MTIIVFSVKNSMVLRSPVCGSCVEVYRYLIDHWRLDPSLRGSESFAMAIFAMTKVSKER